MQIIVGLGNPGKNYDYTRHNAGFRVVEELAATLVFPPFGFQAKFQSEVSRKGELILAKPQTFMNRTGEAVQSLVRMYKDQLASSTPDSLRDLFVIHDDLDLELGNYKMQFGTGPKVHNGLLSLYTHLGTAEFWHVRIGVDARQGDRSTPGERYVLMPFPTAEEAQFQALVPTIVEELQSLLAIKSGQ